MLGQEAASGLVSFTMRASFFAALPSRTASLNFCGGIETWTMKSSSSSFLLYRSTVHGRTSQHQIPGVQLTSKRCSAATDHFRRDVPNASQPENFLNQRGNLHGVLDLSTQLFTAFPDEVPPKMAQPKTTQPC
jgi:hypothetical protein